MAGDVPAARAAVDAALLGLVILKAKQDVVLDQATATPEPTAPNETPPK